MAVSNAPTFTERANPPRAVAVRFPFGHALGQVGHRLEQRRVLLEALLLLAEATAPELRRLPLRWKRTDYAKLDPVVLPDGRALR